MGRDLRSALGAARLAVNSEEFEAPIEGGAGEVFGKDIRRVLGAEDLEDAQVPAAHSLLNPKLARGQVSNLTNPAPFDDAEGRAGVRVKLQGDRDSKVEEKGA